VDTAFVAPNLSHRAPGKVAILPASSKRQRDRSARGVLTAAEFASALKPRR
jgi:hypothetical protein